MRESVRAFVCACVCRRRREPRTWRRRNTYEEIPRTRTHLFDDDFAVLVNGAVVHHAHNGHAQIAPNPERDAKAQAAHDSDDVAARESEARAVT